jgi:ADP-ribose pyrophosphatase YjhB (NUDIX family)
LQGSAVWWKLVPVPTKDYYDDIHAPRANRIVPAVTAIVRNDAGEVLLIERTDNGFWAAPGGAQEIGEPVIGAVHREVHEETGIEVQVIGLSGIFSDPRHVIAYDDGEVRQEFALSFHARPVGGELRLSAATSSVRWVAQDRLPELPIHRSMRLRIAHAIAEPTTVYLG